MRSFSECFHCNLAVLVQIAWYGRDKVIPTGTENGPVSGVGRSSAEDGTQLINAVDDSELSSDDELFGLLDKSGRRVTDNGSYTVIRDASRDCTVRGVQQYVGNASSMLTGISINHSTVVH